MKIPYPMVAAVENQKRHAQMAVALQANVPRLEQQPIDDSKSLTIAAYGPSLEDTWQTMTRPILAMSGATRWLADRGLIADFHADMDPRPNKVLDITPPVDGVHYLMATVCPPKTWDVLKGRHVTQWHVYSGEETYDWVGVNDNGALVIRGGSTIGLTALHVGGVLGYRHFEIHGMDGSFRDLSRAHRHAGPHTGHTQLDGITWDAGGVRYATSKIMSNAVAETKNALATFPIFCVFHGNGLTQALVREWNYPNACCADETAKAERIRRATAHIYDMALADPKRGETPHTAMWDTLAPTLDLREEADLLRIRAMTEPLRAKAAYNTGSITLEQMRQLRAICLRWKPQRIAEIGAFIGNSTYSFTAPEIYTCDRDNDCIARTPTIMPFPKQSSTDMLGFLWDRGLKVDLFFFDGRIQLPDLPLILALSHLKTLFVCDDYAGTEKGVINAKLLAGILPPRWILVDPDHRLADKSTLAVLAPLELFRA